MSPQAPPVAFVVPGGSIKPTPLSFSGPVVDNAIFDGEDIFGRQAASPTPTPIPGATTNSDVKPIIFTNTAVNRPTRIIDVDSNTQAEYQVQWQKIPGYVITAVEWEAKQLQTGPLATGVLMTPTPQTVSAQEFSYADDLSSGSATIRSFTYKQLQPRRELFGEDLFLKIFWRHSESQERGIAISPVFTVLESSDNQKAQQYINSFAADPGGKRTLGSVENLDPSTSDTGRNGANPDSTLTAGVNPTLGTGSNIGTTGISSSSGSSGKSGLGTGAIAGIAVGGAIFLILIGVLAWFLMRRRRQAKDHVLPYDGHSGHEFIGDKETTARVAESPHSPYSDDGQARNSALLHNQDGGPTVIAAQDRSFAPYSDSGPLANAQAQDSTRNGARSETPQGVSSAVAHLVEEGMTDAEIRRLEEEERALDHAIEQAGRRP